MIRVHGLSKTFYVHKKAPGLRASLKSLFRRERVAKDAVAGVSLDVSEGEIVGLLGPNGAGKTTLVKMLAGIIHPTAGKAEVLGYTPWERDNRFRRQIALIMGQKAQLWWDLPAADCFLLLKEIYRVPDDEYEETLAYLTGVLEVEPQLNIQIRRLSLGERMKMELIAALLHRPRVVFLDEPTIGLDLSAQRAIRDFILRYREEHKPAMILTSHYMEDIQRLCERIVIIREGEFVYDGRLCERIVIIREGEFVYDGPLQRVVELYAPSKVIRAHLRKSDRPVRVDGELSRLGEVVECNEEQICLRVPRGEVAHASARILETYPVADLAIEEMDVGTIIERIFRERGQVGA
jgi:ABC-2 type transport system ATP-binding protein